MEKTDQIIYPVMLDEANGYHLLSYNSKTKELYFIGWEGWLNYKVREGNLAQKVVPFLESIGIPCYGYWYGYVGEKVAERWSTDNNLNVDGEPQGNAEYEALECLITEDPNFIENNCQFIACTDFDGEDPHTKKLFGLGGVSFFM